MSNLTRFVVVALSSSCILVSACGGGSVRPPSGVDSPQEKALLTTPADFAFVANVDRIRTDLIYRPLFDEAAKHPNAMDDALGKVTAIDAIGVLDGATWAQTSLVATVRGTPEAPEVPKGVKKSLAKLAEGHMLPSGVVEYVTLNTDGWPWGFYVLPHDWALLGGRAAGKGHDYFASSSALPPLVDFGPDVLVGYWMGGDVMKRAAMKELAKAPGNEGLESVRMELRDGVHGDLLVDGRYDGADHAKAASDLTLDRLGMYASIWKRAVDECPGLGALRVEAHAEGRMLHMRVSKIPEAIRAILDCAHDKGTHESNDDTTASAGTKP